MPKTVGIPYTDDLLVSAGISLSELEKTARIATAAKLFQDGRISLGQAAAMCGYGKVAFMHELTKYGCSCVNLGVDAAEDELRFIHDDE